jgi:archaellum component FlaC
VIHDQLCVIRIPTNRRGAEKFLRKLAGMADLEDALKKLDRLTQEEARMAHVEVLRITHSIRDEVKIIDGKVEGVDDKVDGVGDKVEEVSDKVEDVGDKVQCVDDKVQVVIDGTRALSSRLQNPSNIYTFRQSTSKSRGKGHR